MVRDEELAARAADQAGRLLLAMRDEGRLAGAELGAAADAAANRVILAAIKDARPADAILSEESPDDPARLGRSRLWIVDPLDGTAEYAAARDDWAVHVGLAIDGRPAAGALAVPAWGLLVRTDLPPSLPPLRAGPPRIAVSRSRPPAVAARVADRLGAELVEMGSAGAKTAAVLTGLAEAYMHAGGQHEWDNCAPAAAALAAGLHASRINGTPLRYNRFGARTPDLLICRPELAAHLLELVHELG